MEFEENLFITIGLLLLPVEEICKTAGTAYNIIHHRYMDFLHFLNAFG